eukprot:883547-Amphidinium_carterae.1
MTCRMNRTVWAVLFDNFCLPRRTAARCDSNEQDPKIAASRLACTSSLCIVCVSRVSYLRLFAQCGAAAGNARPTPICIARGTHWRTLV